MANTEGMPDEAIESLFGNSISTTGSKKGVEHAAERRRRVIEERMEMSMGDRPAARVIRSSRKNNDTKRQPTQQQQQQDIPQMDEKATTIPPPIIGSIVERTKTKKSQPQAAPSSAGQPRKRQSRFAQQRLQQGPGASSTGFPSVNVPLGTFVKSKKKTMTPSVVERSTAIQPGSTFINSQPHSSQSAPSLTVSAAQEADAMLAQMSPEERMEKARELQAALSPETVVFLKKRADAKKKPKTDNKIPTIDDDQKKESPTKVKEQSDKEPESGDSVAQKQRLASVLANIKTVGDLDSAFQAEMGDYSPLQSSEISREVAQQAKEDPFPLACTLLRSTAPRQNLWAAQTVSKHLKEQWERGDLCSLIPMEETKFRRQTPWPYPVMLPASLRCLLDSSVSHTNGYVLHTYVLQAIHNLLRLRACVDHVVDIDMEWLATSSKPTHLAAIYQSFFLEDAVPTPPVGSVYEPIVKLEAVSGTENPVSMSGAAAYKTSSSSKSAQQDGGAFAKDPMWTLLTRMCMIPRLAQLLRTAAHTSREQLVPKEAVVAMAGILAMIGQRSPGAATAIVHHQTLLKHLTEVTLMPRDNSQQPYDPFVALPAIRLLCALARQSRTAAERVPFGNVVPPILAIKPKSEHESELQKWSIILWRILLRYGLGLSSIQTMITIAASHIALGSDPEATPYSLTTEFASSFANILQCLQVARRHLASAKDECVIPKDLFNEVSDADLWLSSSAKQAMTQLEKGIGSHGSESMKGNRLAEYMRFTAGHMQFLTAFLRTSYEEVRLATNGEFKDVALEVSDTWIRSCQQVLVGYIERGLLEEAFKWLSPNAFVVRFNDLPNETNDKASHVLPREAAACSFICAFASLQIYLLAKLRNAEGANTKIEDTATKLSLTLVVSQFATTLDKCANKTPVVTSSPNTIGLPMARRGWLNRACFAVLELLNAAKDFGVLPSSWGSAETDLLRTLHFTLIGRLERGDEAMAVVLFSQDSHFRARKRIDAQSANEDSSLLSSMFFREICRTSNERVQLDHSFKLKHGPGITSEEVGAFRLRSLLSDIDIPGQDGGDTVLPLGTMWLWQVLSSPTSAQPKENVIPEGSGSQGESVHILSSSLDLILEVEQDAASGCSGGHFVSNIPVGAKVYHLMNICLQPESVLQHDMVTAPAGKLLEIYGEEMDEGVGLEFAKACTLHSDAGTKKSTADSSKEKELSKTEKFASKLLEGPGSGWRSLGEKDMRTVVDFTGELCEAYIEYGAQYDFFTSCVRSFAHPTFPPRVRSQAMNRLGDVLNRIALPGEDDASDKGREKLVSLLCNGIAGSLPSVDGSTRDPPDFLDAVASIYKGGNPYICFGYSSLFNVMVHARHLAVCCQPEALGFDAAKKRLLNVNPQFTSVVVDATEQFLKSSPHQKLQLVNATIDAVLFSQTQEKPVLAATGTSNTSILAEQMDALRSFGAIACRGTKNIDTHFESS